MAPVDRGPTLATGGEHPALHREKAVDGRNKVDDPEDGE
jgi:hypothetical protein